MIGILVLLALSPFVIFALSPMPTRQGSGPNE